MTQVQNRALRGVLLGHLRHLDRFVMYLETAPGVTLKGTIYEGIRTETSYLRASIRAAIHQLEDRYDNRQNPPERHGPGISQPTGSDAERTQ